MSRDPCVSMPFPKSSCPWNKKLGEGKEEKSLTKYAFLLFKPERNGVNLIHLDKLRKGGFE
jgi:hypothetical protein